MSLHKSENVVAYLRFLHDNGDSRLYFDCSEVLALLQNSQSSQNEQSEDTYRRQKSTSVNRSSNTKTKSSGNYQVTSQSEQQKTKSTYTDKARVPLNESGGIVTTHYEIPNIAVEDKKSALAEYDQKINTCSKCRLHQGRTKFVFGAGNPNADLMFIGEAPGKNEDETGLPFVGRAGELLDKILAAMTLSRDEVFIGNVIKCRPPNNRDPQPDEVAECVGYLLHQIAIIRPKLICFLGRISAQTLLETKQPMRELRKSMHKFAGIPAVVTYHPAALLRNPAYKRPVWDDMQNVMKFLDIPIP
jgi:DNA polymerase